MKQKQLENGATVTSRGSATYRFGAHNQIIPDCFYLYYISGTWTPAGFYEILKQVLSLNVYLYEKLLAQVIFIIK